MLSETSQQTTGLGVVTAPERLKPQHELSYFDCGVATLNTFLISDALDNQAKGTAITYVVCAPGTKRVLGYFALASGAVDREKMMGKLKKNMPRSVPVTILGRLAVDTHLKGQGVGYSLLLAAWQTAADQARLVGSVALMINALPDAVDFYKRYGFKPLPSDELTLVKSLR